MVTTEVKDCYALLGVPRNATPEQIRIAYRALAHQWHPDHNSSPHAPEIMVQLNEAFATLSNPQLKAIYDSKLNGKHFTFDNMAEAVLHFTAELKKHELDFYELHKRLYQEVTNIQSLLKKEPQATVNLLLYRKGISYESTVLRKRVVYDLRKENDYKTARARFLILLDKLGARGTAHNYLTTWNKIETTLAEIYAIMVKDNNWRGKFNNFQFILNGIRRVEELQSQILSDLTDFEERIRKLA